MTQTFGNIYGYDPEHILFNIANANDEVTIFIAGSGTENATTKYLNKGSLASGFRLNPDQNVVIVRIGSKTFRDPIEVSANTNFIWRNNIKEFNEIVIRASAANANVRFLAL